MINQESDEEWFLLIEVICVTSACLSPFVILLVFKTRFFCASMFSAGENI